MIPKNRRPTHPGEFLQDFLDEYGISQQEFAKHLGGTWTQPKINAIVKGKRGITPQSALAFSDAFGKSPEFWLNAQRAYELWQANQEHNKIKRLKSA